MLFIQWAETQKPPKVTLLFVVESKSQISSQPPEGSLTAVSMSGESLAFD